MSDMESRPAHLHLFLVVSTEPQATETRKIGRLVALAGTSLFNIM